MISRATTFILFKPQAHPDACAEAGTKNDLSQTT